MKILTVMGFWWTDSRSFEGTLADSVEMGINADAIVVVRGGGEDFPDCSAIDTADGNQLAVKEPLQSLLARLAAL